MHKVVHRVKLSIVGLTLASTAVGIGGVVAVTAAIAATQTMVASTDVNMRAGAGMSYDVVGVVPEGATVTATGTSGSWVAVTYDGRSGYVYGSYLSPKAGSETGATTDGSSAGTARTTADLNVRTGPGTGYQVVDVLLEGAAVETTGTTSGNWTQILHQGERRWVSSSYLTTGGTSGSGTSGSGTDATTRGQVRATADLNLRAEGYYGATIVGVLPADSIVDVTGETTASYTQVVYQGTTAWVASSYLSLVSSGPATAGPLSSTLSAKQKALVDFVNARVGYPYVWAAEGPDAYDCSGLTTAAYRSIGVSIPHYSGYQATLGTAVSRDNLQPGDLIFWFSPVSHVSLYIGDGMMVHARNTQVGVVKQSVQSYIDYGAYYAGARRILNP